jgi:HTH-type transcriptional regulator / antitoxin HipB
VNVPRALDRAGHGSPVITSLRNDADGDIDVTPFDSDKVVKYHDSDIGVGGVMAYTGKVTSAESLGRILQQARLLAGLSQRELARRLGTTQKYVWELEAGKPSILMDRLFGAMRETGMELTATITPQDEHG